MVSIISVGEACIVQFGDRAETDAKLIAIAVQRQESHSTAGDVFFESYPMYFNPVPVLNDPDFDNGQVIQLERTNCIPNITVGVIAIIAVASSTSVLIGNGMDLTADSRIKNIRQYPRQKPYPPIGC
jgi:spore germination protein PE